MRGASLGMHLGTEVTLILNFGSLWVPDPPNRMPNEEVVKDLLLEGVMEVPEQVMHTSGMVRAMGNRESCRDSGAV